MPKIEKQALIDCDSWQATVQAKGHFSGSKTSSSVYLSAHFSDGTWRWQEKKYHQRKHILHVTFHISLLEEVSLTKIVILKFLILNGFFSSLAIICKQCFFFLKKTISDQYMASSIRNAMLSWHFGCSWSLQWAGLTVCRWKCKHWAQLSYVEANHFWQSLQCDKHRLSTVPLYLKVTNILLKCKQLTSWLVKQWPANLSKIKKTKILFDTG